MKTKLFCKSVVVGLTILAAAADARAQGFDAGSDGSLGDVTISSNTNIVLPPDGVLHYQKLTVNAGATVTFTRNALNTPVVLLSQDDITIAGTLNVDGQPGTSNPPVGGLGGPGGFDGGMPGFGAIGPGAGHGPGAGPAGNGRGSYGGLAASTPRGPTYGSGLLVPLLGGSGGGGTAGTPGDGGHGGGGAILLASNTRIVVSGSVFARGGHATSCCPAGGAGSGGAIRLVAPVLQGSGTLNVNGGNDNAGLREGGHGRIRIDTIDRAAMIYTFTPLTAVSIGAFLKVFLDNPPKLEIIEVAEEVIPPGAPATVILPFGTDPNQNVRVRATNFADGMVPIRVTLTPDSGDPLAYDADISVIKGTAELDVPVVLPINNTTRVHVWTR